jgi:hypothetical protein
MISIDCSSLKLRVKFLRLTDRGNGREGLITPNRYYNRLTLNNLEYSHCQRFFTGQMGRCSLLAIDNK